MYCMRYLDDISSLITIACCVPELRTIEFRPFPIENVLGGATFAPPSTFSMGNRQNSLAHTSHTHSHVQCCLQLSRIPQTVQNIPLSLGSTWDPKGHPGILPGCPLYTQSSSLSGGSLRTSRDPPWMSPVHRVRQRLAVFLTRTRKKPSNSKQVHSIIL